MNKTWISLVIGYKHIPLSVMRLISPYLYQEESSQNDLQFLRSKSKDQDQFKRSLNWSRSGKRSRSIRWSWSFRSKIMIFLQVWICTCTKNFRSPLSQWPLFEAYPRREGPGPHQALPSPLWHLPARARTWTDSEGASQVPCCAVSGLWERISNVYSWLVVQRRLGGELLEREAGVTSLVERITCILGTGGGSEDYCRRMPHRNRRLT